MREAFPEAAIEAPKDLVEAIHGIPDLSDRHVLATALRGGAHAIITANTKHFPVDCLAQYDLVAQTPDEFLVHQYHLAPEQVLGKLDDQATNLGKERAFIVERLRPMTPTFSALIEHGQFSEEGEQTI